MFRYFLKKFGENEDKAKQSDGMVCERVSESLVASFTPVYTSTGSFESWL